MEPTKAEKQIVINAARKIGQYYVAIEVSSYLEHESGPVHMKEVWRVVLRQGHVKSFPTEYDAALYVLKQELLR